MVLLFVVSHLRMLYVDHLRNFHCFAECKGVWWIGKVVVVGGGCMLTILEISIALLNVKGCGG